MTSPHMPPPRCYTARDLKPRFLDPRCSQQFPLAAHWPVYLGNFLCLGPTEQQPTIVQEYFAVKGLLAPIVFARNIRDDRFRSSQKQNRIYDFLVYFVSKQDANDAVAYCHRDTYHGHRLNVFPGRQPAYFDQTRSVKYVLVQNAFCTEQIIENSLVSQTGVQIGCIIKHSDREVFVEYRTPHDLICAIQRNELAIPEKVKRGSVKQRFMEQDVEQEILARIAEDPYFIDMRPPTNILLALLRGRKPKIACQSYISKPLVTGKIPKLMGKEAYHRCAKSARNWFGVKCDFVDDFCTTNAGLAQRALNNMIQYAEEVELVWTEHYPNAYDEYMAEIMGRPVKSKWPSYKNCWTLPYPTGPSQKQILDVYYVGLNCIRSVLAERNRY